MAKLSLSVPPLVKTTSDGSAPISAATALRAWSIDRLGPLPEVVDARRVAELLPQRGRHGVGDRREDRGRGVMVEIDALHGTDSVL